MEHVARFLALSIVFVMNNIKISERSEPKISKVMLKVHKNITENVYLPDFRGAYASSAPPPLNPPVNTHILFITAFIFDYDRQFNIIVHNLRTKNF